MPEHIANAHRTTTRTKRAASRSLSRSNRDHTACPDAIGIAFIPSSHVAPSLDSFTLCHTHGTQRKNCTSHTNPFASTTSIPVFRPAPALYAIVKPGRLAHRVVDLLADTGRYDSLAESVCSNLGYLADDFVVEKVTDLLEEARTAGKGVPGG